MVHCDHNHRLFICMLQIKGLVSWKQLLHLESSAAAWEGKAWRGREAAGAPERGSAASPASPIPPSFPPSFPGAGGQGSLAAASPSLEQCTAFPLCCLSSATLRVDYFAVNAQCSSEHFLREFSAVKGCVCICIYTHINRCLMYFCKWTLPKYSIYDIHQSKWVQNFYRYCLFSSVCVHICIVCFE